MEFGGCVKLDMGHMGCFKDVRYLADKICSGKRRCKIEVPDLQFEETQPCLDLKSYLEISYSCVKVPPIDGNNCGQPRRVPATSGYIGSIASHETWCGVSDTPWQIEAKPGQRINLTLIDFGSTTSHTTSGQYYDSYSDIEVCERYATIREKSPEKETVVCGGRERKRHLLLTNGNSLEIEIDGRRSEPNHFLIQYQVIGCPDPELSSNAWFKRENNQIRIGCRHNKEEWTYECQGVKWNGVFPNCTKEILPEAISANDGFHGLPKSLIIAAVIAIAAIVGMIIVMLGFIYFKRFNLKWNHEPYVDRDIESEKPPISPKSTEESDFGEESDCDDENIHKLADLKEQTDMYLRPTTDCGQTKNITSSTNNQETICNDPIYGVPIYVQPDVTQPVPPPRNPRSPNEYTHIWQMPLPIPGESL